MLENTKTQLANAQAQIETSFPQEEELKTKSARLDELNILLNMDHKEKENKQTDQEQKTGKFRISRAFFNSSRKQSHTIEVELA